MGSEMCIRDSNNAAENASVSSSRAPTPSVAYFHGAVPAKGTSVTSAVPLNPGSISTKGTRASCAVPIGHGQSLAKGTRANGAVPLSRGINSATGGRVSNAAPLNQGTGACASRAVPLSHAPRRKQDVATARRPPTRTCSPSPGSPSPGSDQVLAVGLRCGKPNSKNTSCRPLGGGRFEVWEGQH